jgi:transposase
MQSHTPSPKDQPVAPNGRHVVGIDIGQQRHAAAGLTAAGAQFGRELAFDNNRAGVDLLEQRLLTPLGGPGRVLIGMEATGHYWLPLYYALTARGYSVVVINPIQTRAKFRTRIRKTKTDKLDARSIARLVLAGEAQAARIPDAATFELRLLVRQRWRLLDLAGGLERFMLSLIDRLFPEYPGLFSSPLIHSGHELIRHYGLAPQRLVAESAALPQFLRATSHGRLAAAKIAALLRAARSSIGVPVAQDLLVRQLQSTQSLVETLAAQIADVDRELEQRMAARPSPLASLGLSAPLLATIHAESDPITDFKHVWQYVAYTGLDPSTYDSGKMHGSHVHISKRGSPHLRHALYLAAFALYRQHKELLRLYQRMRTAGHRHVDALVIVAHKLARITWRLLTDQRPFKARPPVRPATHPPSNAAR